MYKDGTLENSFREKETRTKSNRAEKNSSEKEILTSEEDRIQFIREFDPGSG